MRSVAASPDGNPRTVIRLLSLAWLACWLAIDRWQRQPDPQFSAAGIPLLAWYVLAALALAALLRSLSSPKPAPGATLVLALGLVPLPLLLASVATYFLEPSWFWAAVAAVTVYLLVYLLRGMHAVTGRSQRGAALLGLMFLAVFVAVSDAVDAIPDIWSPREVAEAEAAVEDGLGAREAALFEQSGRIDAALESVHRDPAMAAQAFFLGFAGVGEQKVFAQEIGLAARVLGERYGMGDRQVSLINDERRLDGAPLASVTALNYTLQGMAARMDLRRDVLFLSISSHGSDVPSIAVSNSQFPFVDLTGEDLRNALDEAHVEWRVIVISACYAGGFIEPLRNPQTIVITAAAKDRTSFGCSNDSDLTYFGEAFYRDALPGAKSLRSAFAAAKTSIADRESREHETASDPQAFFGAEIEKKLATMTR